MKPRKINTNMNKWLFISYKEIQRQLCTAPICWAVHILGRKSVHGKCHDGWWERRSEEERDLTEAVELREKGNKSCMASCHLGLSRPFQCYQNHNSIYSSHQNAWGAFCAISHWKLHPGNIILTSNCEAMQPYRSRKPGSVSPCLSRTWPPGLTSVWEE